MGSGGPPLARGPIGSNRLRAGPAQGCSGVGTVFSHLFAPVTLFKIQIFRFNLCV